jgi:hypothetical protein
MPGRDVPPARPAEPHDMLNSPAGEPDPTEWLDPYDRRADPRDPRPLEPIPLGNVPHTPTGAHSTSEPHLDQDPEAVRSKALDREKLDEQAPRQPACGRSERVSAFAEVKNEDVVLAVERGHHDS